MNKPFTLVGHAPLPDLRLLAADGTQVSYPVRADLPAYDRVPILSVGEFHPHGVAKWIVDEALLKSFAKSYDPRFYAASVNCDHCDFMGPAQGIIVRLYAEDGTLYADLVNVEPYLAWQIDAGQWPHRSVEWWQESLLGEKFYGKHPDYITGLALLGTDSPAVPGLGPMPGRATPADDKEPERLVIPYANPLAANALRERALHLISSKEATVDDEADTETDKTKTSPAPEGAAESPEQLQARNAQLEQDKAALEARAAGDTQTTVSELKAKNAQLEADVARLSASERQTRIDNQVTALYASGSLTPAQEPFVRDYLAQHLDAAAVKLQAGQERKYEEGKDPLALLQGILKNQPQIPGKASAHQAPPDPGAGGDTLSPEEERACKAAGLSREQFLAAKHGRPLPAAATETAGGTK